MGVGGSNRRGGGARRSRLKGGAAPDTGAHLANGKPTGAAGGQEGSLIFTIPSDLEQGHHVQRQILQAAQANGFHGESFFALRIALEEALMNAIKHGNRLDPLKKVHIEARVAPGKVEIIVEDEGAGFDRNAVPDPTSQENLAKTSGRGILLIESYMNKVKWDRGGRRLRMIREDKPTEKN
ncbi:MAG TPA: ATP-binding protein [Tepidisphaeraceae bacterium]|nr:ATP-binding protein [Tepidisphaeraceae bacterium]